MQKESYYDVFFFPVLDLNVDNDLLLAERQMQAMAKVLHKLICDGNELELPNLIWQLITTLFSLSPRCQTS